VSIALKTDEVCLTNDAQWVRCADAEQRLIDNLASSLGNGVPQRIQELQIQHFHKADPAYGSGVAKGLSLNIDTITTKKQANAADSTSTAELRLIG
jgi:catalase